MNGIDTEWSKTDSLYTKIYAISSIVHVSLKMQTPAIINNMQTSFPDQGLLSQNQQN